MPAILIDTNVLLYPFDTQSPRKAQQAQRVLEHLELARLGRLSVQNLAEFVHVATRKLQPPLSPAHAHAQVDLFMQMWPVYDLTPMVILEAVRGMRDHSLPYYDAQIWAIARLNQVSTIFSEDFNSGQTLEGVRFIDPFSDKFNLENFS